MRLFAKLTGCRVQGSGLSSPEARASTRLPVSFSQELSDTIEEAIVSVREETENGPRVMVISRALRGAFIFSAEEADRRIRIGFPELADECVTRGVRQLATRVRLAHKAATHGDSASRRRASWVHGWME